VDTRGSITLGELDGKLTMLEIACHRCERRGRVSLPRLIDDHGADTGLPHFVGKPRGRLPERANNGGPQRLRHLLPAIAGAAPAEQIRISGGPPGVARWCALDEQGFGKDCLLIPGA
jgi:hypothetical protein